MKVDTSETMSAHFLKFDRLICELKSTGGVIEETDVVCHLLLTLPSEYDAVVTALETLSTEQLKISFVKNRPLDEEAKHCSMDVTNDGNKHAAFATSKNIGKKIKLKIRININLIFSVIIVESMATKEPTAGNLRKTIKVHLEVQISLQRVTRKIQMQKKNSHLTRKQLEGKTLTWILDSGATEHMARSSENLVNIKTLRNPIQIHVAKSGHKLTATEYGEFEVRTQVNKQARSITIKEVLLVPYLQYNLLSVRKLEMNGYTVQFCEKALYRERITL